MDKPKTALDALQRIYALANNPHWTASRRWEIAQLAGDILNTAGRHQAVWDSLGRNLPNE